MLWLLAISALIIILSGIIMLKIELYYLRKKSERQWVLLEKEHIKLGEAALNLTDFLKFHDIKNTKPYKNVLTCQQHLKTVNTVWDKFQVYRTMLITLKNLIDTTKDYPECRADRIYIQNVNDIRNLETTINQLCLLYNNYTNKYNFTVSSFPINLIARLLNIKEKNII